MPLNWDKLSLSEQSEEILKNISGLTPEDKRQIYARWSKNQYPDDGFGQISALADLQDYAVEQLLRRQGRWGAEKKRLEGLRQDVLEREQ